MIKRLRQQQIRDRSQRENIRPNTSLPAALRERGYRHQATISRDVREMGSINKERKRGYSVQPRVDSRATGEERFPMICTTCRSTFGRRG